jgi:hypothetical protein
MKGVDPSGPGARGRAVDELLFWLVSQRRKEEALPRKRRPIFTFVLASF